MEIPPILSGFDAIKLTDEKGHSYWKARDLAKALGYAGYRNFKPVIGKAMENCKANGKPIVQHFIGFHEMTELPSGLFGEVENLKLTRYACLLIATNANKRKPNVVQAQSYFSGNTSSPAIYDTRENLHLLLYKTPGKKNGIETIFGDNTCWLSKKEMAGLFSVNVSTIRRHLEQVFEPDELDKEKTTVKFPVIPENGKSETRHWVKHYNLDVIIAVGYRINSYQATQFRIWATNVLKGIILKSSPDDKENELLSKLFGRNYFDQLLERIRETRLSERQYFQKLADIYAECSIDYEPNSTLTNDFFKNIQNRLHWAITHKTAAQIIYERADAGKPSMGLMNWKNAPNGKIMKSDAGIAKNYLSEEEVSRMNILATSLLDFAENQVLRGNIMTMEQWLRKLDIYLEVSNYDLLPDKVDITPEQARQKAEEEYEEFKNRLKSK